ncbi:unnamed protein product [Closterium sp. NIES-64]|nr:unnamed protein product [Closterium sp. NIES-64]
MENMFSSMACMAHGLLGTPDVTPGKVDRAYSLHWSPCNVTLTLIWCVPALVGGFEVLSGGSLICWVLWHAGMLAHRSVFMVETAWVDPSDLFKGGQVDVSTADTTWTHAVPSYDVIVFNTGNWWKPRQLERYGLTLNPPFHHTGIVEAYPHGLATILTALHRWQRVTARAFLVTSVSFQFNASCPATQPIADVATARTTMAALTRRKNEVLKAVLQRVVEEEGRESERDEAEKDVVGRKGQQGQQEQQEQQEQQGQQGQQGQQARSAHVGGKAGVRGSSIRLLDIHDLSLFRHDARPAAYHGRQSSLHDCAHYCVPGVPDTWNELLLGMLAE